VQGESQGEDEDKGADEIEEVDLQASAGGNLAGEKSRTLCGEISHTAHACEVVWASSEILRAANMESGLSLISRPTWTVTLNPKLGLSLISCFTSTVNPKLALSLISCFTSTLNPKP
jgi:hypothetical protein